MANHGKFVTGIVPPEVLSDPAWWFVFRESKLLVYQKSDSITIPFLDKPDELNLTIIRQNYLGHLDNRHCYAAEVPEGTIPPTGMDFEGLRQVYGRLEDDLFWIAARAVQIIDWDRTHQF